MTLAVAGDDGDGAGAWLPFWYDNGGECSKMVVGIPLVLSLMLLVVR